MPGDSALQGETPLCRSSPGECARRFNPGPSLPLSFVLWTWARLNSLDLTVLPGKYKKNGRNRWHKLYNRACKLEAHMLWQAHRCVLFGPYSVLKNIISYHLMPTFKKKKTDFPFLKKTQSSSFSWQTEDWKRRARALYSGDLLQLWVSCPPQT